MSNASSKVRPRRRELRPHDPVSMRPAMISQLTSEMATGVDARRFLEHVVPRCPNVARVGKLRVVRLEDAERAILAMAKEEGAEIAGELPPARDELESVDKILASIGRRRVGGQ